MEIKYLHFESINSTRLWVKEHEKELKEDTLTVVSALEQTAGQGKFGRVWHSTKGDNILCTVTFFADTAPNIILVWALSAIDVIEKLGLAPRFKWPNDIQIDGKKLGGVLCDKMNTGLVALSLGLNVNMSDLSTIDQRATSLFNETGKTFEVDKLLKDIVETFHSKLSLFWEKGFAPFTDRFSELITFQKGEKIHFDDYQKEHIGLFHSIGTDGALILELLPDHKLKRFLSGEVRHHAK